MHAWICVYRHGYNVPEDQPTVCKCVEGLTGITVRVDDISYEK